MIPIMERKSILIVDDDPGILNSFKEILEPEGYNVDTAQTGSEALEKCKARLYNIAVIDINLPDTDGTELLPKIHGMLPKARKIILTGYPTLDNAVSSDIPSGDPTPTCQFVASRPRSVTSTNPS